jgi:simple sugar transport system permease protein
MFSSTVIITFLQRAVIQGIPLLYGSTGEILTEKSGNLNLGIPGIMYVGGISGVIGAFLYEQSLSSKADANAFLSLFIPIMCTIIGSLLAGLIYCFLTVTLRANQNVTGLALTTFGVGFGNFFGASLVKLTKSEVPSVALTTTSAFFTKKLPFASTTGWFGKIFFSYGFLAYLAIIVALLVAYFLKRTRGGLHLRAVGENPATADAAGINVNRSKYLATCIGSIIAGFGGLYYVMDYANGVWSNEGFGDRGWLAIALVIFAIWRPNMGILGSIVFGGLYIVYLFLPGLTLRSQELFKMLPYVVTILVLIVVSVRKKKEDQPPASLGLSYFREDR